MHAPLLHIHPVRSVENYDIFEETFICRRNVFAQGFVIFSGSLWGFHADPSAAN